MTRISTDTISEEKIDYKKLQRLLDEYNSGSLLYRWFFRRSLKKRLKELNNL